MTLPYGRLVHSILGDLRKPTSDNVGVLICTMDRPALLQRCLNAIAEGTVAPRSVVVVDQGTATNDTFHLLRAFASRCRFEVVHRRSRGGMARGQNEGVGLVDASVVLVTDDDCVPAPDWVEVVSDLFAREADLGLVGGRVLPLGLDDPDRPPVASRTSVVASELDAHSPPWLVGSGNNFAIRRACMLAVGGNDERLGPGAKFRGAADMDLFRRVLRTGTRCRYEPRLLVHHERATHRSRRGRQTPYGYGMGMACALWWRQGDPDAAAIARRYGVMRLRRLKSAVRAAEPTAAWDETLVALGMLRGAARAVALRDPTPLGRRDRGT